MSTNTVTFAPESGYLPEPTATYTTSTFLIGGPTITTNTTWTVGGSWVLRDSGAMEWVSPLANFGWYADPVFGMSTAEGWSEAPAC